MKDLKQWVKEICRGNSARDFVKVVLNDGEGTATDYIAKFRCRIYTHDNVYALVAIDRKRDQGYLGCVASARKPRAGKDWTRGNDLPDGPYIRETWEKIKNAIIAYELVKIAKPREQQPNVEKDLPVKEDSVNDRQPHP